MQHIHLHLVICRTHIQIMFMWIFKTLFFFPRDGFGLMEAGYSVGLAIGILVFFNHIAVKKLNTDPTPLEVEMRLYEENICKTLIDQAGRKEKEIDVD